MLGTQKIVANNVPAASNLVTLHLAGGCSTGTRCGCVSLLRVNDSSRGKLAHV
jgi:hypothetical protein